MIFDRFFDDAAIFPPGNAPLDVAVKAHLDRAATADGRYVGPFVIDEARLPALADLLTEPLDIALVTRTPVASDRGTREREGAGEVESPLVHVVAVEGPGGHVVEKPWGSGFEVPDGAILKLRCGGDYVPTVAELSDAITYCVEHDQPFKLTAGLHAAITHDGGHGFVNVMAAVVAVMHGKEACSALMAWADELDLATLGEARRLFRSIGTCSIDEPLADLRHLGLIR